MGYNVSHFFFDNDCATNFANCPVVSEMIDLLNCSLSYNV